jgi:uncharacterized delta-60 repeat protein
VRPSSFHDLRQITRQCLVVAVMATTVIGMCGICAPSYARDPIPGSLHTTPFPGFALGTGKITNIEFTAGASEHGHAYAVALQSDGKIVMVGECTVNLRERMCVARLNIDGSRDVRFVGPDGLGDGKFVLPMMGQYSGARTLSLQSDGRIVIAGNCGELNKREFCLIRLNVDGSLDASFTGPDGTSSGHFQLLMNDSNDALTGVGASAVIVQPDGKILVAGNCRDVALFTYFFCAARLNVNGTLDRSFGSATDEAKVGRVHFSIGPASDILLAAAAQHDGKLILVGTCATSLRGVPDTAFCVARLTTDGRLDDSFDGDTGVGNGRFFVPVGMPSGGESANAVAIQADGKIVLTGDCFNGRDRDFCALRLNNADGSLDAHFNGPSGIGGGKFLLPIGTNDNVARAIAMQPDGKILLAGSCQTVSSSDFCLARLNDDGSLDEGFDGPENTGNGAFQFPMNISPQFGSLAHGLALQPDGKTVLVGQCWNDNDSKYAFCAARLNGGPYAAQNCKLDIDGDGEVLASTDMLIAARVALGMRGNVVIGGITFARNAIRQTWVEIHDYLVSQCGLSIAR